MKTKTLILTALVLIATGVFADETAKPLTIAAADVSIKATWVETKEDVQRHLEEDLAKKTKELNDSVNAKLEDLLAEKLAQDLGL